MEKDIDSIRLDSLLKATINTYYDEVNPDNELDLYDKMFEKLVNGELDNVFLCPMIDGKKEREKIFSLAKNYISLCFLQNNPDYWTDSIEGVGVIDTELLCRKILSNYNYLLEVAYQNGEDSLKELKLFENSKMAKNSSVVDYLRNTFSDDDLLKKVLLTISSNDSFYKNLDIKIKEALMTYPEGTLFYVEDKEKIIASEEFLLNKIKSNYDNSITRRVNSIKDLVEQLTEDDLVQIIRDISIDSTGLLVDKNKSRNK